MPKINWGDVEEKRGGSVSNPPSGAYECRITRAFFQTSKNKGIPQVRLVWDVASGSYADSFASAPESIDWKHADDLNLSGKGLGITKHKLHALADANPGFKPTASIDADRWQDFEGKRCYLLVQATVETYNGYDQYKYRVVDWLSPEEFRAGDFKVPDTIDNREAPAASPVVHAPEPPAADVYDEDIPF